jgi:hypothetical protein
MHNLALGKPSLNNLLSKDLASTGCDLCWRDSHQTVGQTSAKEMWRRHRRNKSWWWEPDKPLTQVDYAMETLPTSATRHKGSSLNKDVAPPLRDSSGTSSCISEQQPQHPQGRCLSRWHEFMSTCGRALYFLLTNFRMRLLCAKKLCRADTQKCVPHLLAHLGRCKSQITNLETVICKHKWGIGMLQLIQGELNLKVMRSFSENAHETIQRVNTHFLCTDEVVLQQLAQPFIRMRNHISRDR